MSLACRIKVHSPKTYHKIIEKCTCSCILCYTLSMQKERSFWNNWGNFLKNWGLQDMAAIFLEAAAPIHLLFAQALYLGKPYLALFVPSDRLTALTTLLEDQDESLQFAAYLREEESTQ